MIMAAICVYFLIGWLWADVYALTLTTLGYGDMTPVSGAAQSFAVLEAITGQLFIAILIARLVGTHISQSRSKESK
ncbi:MAG: two pore domain potassium channel family protein [Deltaproteobacteria bacterium]|nr:two pore domain potassium channel family protein [Deltaproteobacteria bacterium]